MMVNILLQVLADTLQATRGEYPQSGPNIGGNRPERSRLQNPTRLSLGTNTIGFSWPRRIKASTSFVAQLRAETQTTWDPSCIGVKVVKAIFNLIVLNQTKVMG